MYISHLNRVAIDEPHRTFEHTDPIANDALVLFLAVIGDDLVLLTEQIRELEPQPGALDSRIPRVRGVMNDVGRRNQILRRQTSTIDAGTTEGSILRHRRGLAQLCCTNRGGERR